MTTETVRTPAGFRNVEITPEGVSTISYSLVAGNIDKAMPGSVPGAGTITSVSVSVLDDGPGGLDVTLRVLDSSGALKSNTVLISGPVTVPSFSQSTLSVPVETGDFFVVSYDNTTGGFLSVLAILELDTPIS